MRLVRLGRLERQKASFNARILFDLMMMMMVDDDGGRENYSDNGQEDDDDNDTYDADVD